MAKEWYSNGLKAEEVKRLEKRYAKIKNPTFGLTDRDYLALKFELLYESGTETFWSLTTFEDIKELLWRTNISNISELEGKVIEAFVDGNLLRGLSVNKN